MNHFGLWLVAKETERELVNVSSHSHVVSSSLTRPSNSFKYFSTWLDSHARSSAHTALAVLRSTHQSSISPILWEEWWNGRGERKTCANSRYFCFASAVGLFSGFATTAPAAAVVTMKCGVCLCMQADGWQMEFELSRSSSICLSINQLICA